MLTFSYHARDMMGQAVMGEISALSIESAETLMEKQGLIPIKIRPKAESFKRSFSFFKPKLSVKELANLTRQFEVMFSSGIPIEKVLGTLALQTSHEGLRAALMTIKEDVAAGMRMSQAFEKHPQFFAPLYVSMIETGQTGGILDQTLKEMAKILQKEHSVNSKVKSATLYPKIVIVVLVAVFWAMLTFVFPTFLDFYKGFSVALPLPTRIMIGLSTMATSYWHVVLGVVLVSAWGWHKYSLTHKGKHFRGFLAFKLPVFGTLNRLVANSRFGHLTASLYRAGVSLPQALAVVASTVNNIKFSDEVLILIKGIEEGRSMSDSMKQCQFFSSLITEACAVGEQTGRLDHVLDSTALYYDEEIDELVANLSTLIEPIMLVFLFGAVLLLALAVYMPIWNMSKVVLQH